MNGIDHYREAEQLTARVKANGYGDDRYTADMLAAAQVHATLALAAATAVCSPAMFRDGPPDQDLVAWQEVAGGADEPVPSEPGQVDPEPAAPVRIDSLVPRVVDGELITVLHPHWYDGNPVTIVSLRLSAGDYVSVVFQLPGTSDRAAVDVPADFLVTPLPTA